MYRRRLACLQTRRAGEPPAVPMRMNWVLFRKPCLAALDERGNTIAGTALIGLELLSRTHDEFDLGGHHGFGVGDCVG